MGGLGPAQLVWLLPAAALSSTTAVVIGVMTALGANAALTRTGVLSVIGHCLALGVGQSFDVSWLPVAVLVSALLGLWIAVTQLRTLRGATGRCLRFAWWRPCPWWRCC